MTEKFCPSCKVLNKEGAYFCIYCGAPLDPDEQSQFTPRRMATDLEFLSQVLEKKFIDSLEIPERGVALHLPKNTQPIFVLEDKEFVLGRKINEEQEGVIDLTAFDAYECGVSKRHAKIQKNGDGYEVIDLGSTNGTWLDKKRLIPNRAYDLYSGALISLGRLYLYVIFAQKGANRKPDSARSAKPGTA
jgi:hypothetical protein